jgi:peroxiredoxin Q/BCP
VIDPKGKISYVATPFNQMSADAYTDLGNAITQAGSSH